MQRPEALPHPAFALVAIHRPRGGLASDDDAEPRKLGVIRPRVRFHEALSLDRRRTQECSESILAGEALNPRQPRQEWTRS